MVDAVTNELTIVYGSTTISIYTGDFRLLEYYPHSASDDEENITESIGLTVTGSDFADLKGNLESLESALYQARQYSKEFKGDRVYLKFRPNGYTYTYRSEIVGGIMEHSPNIMHNEWGALRTDPTLVITRKNYWEADDETVVPLSNGNGTNSITGINIFNCSDGAGTSPNKHHNYVDIASTAVIGDLPGATRLEFTNTFATDRLGSMWIGQNWTDPDNLAHIIEGESSTLGTPGDGTGTCSNDHFMDFNLSAGAETDMYSWTLAASLLDACKGQYYKLLARFVGGVSYLIKFRIKLKHNSLTIWQSGQFYLDQYTVYTIQDLITLRLPPWLVNQTNLAGLTMVITGQLDSGGPISTDLDFLQVTALDGWRQLQEIAYGVPQNYRLIDDGILGNIYVDDGAGDNKVGVYIGYGSSIQLYPGKKQRLYFLMHSNTALTAEINRSISVKLYYRPRRKTL